MVKKVAVEKEFLSLEEVADLLGVNYQLIYRQVRGGLLPAARIGRVYRVSKKDLEAYLENAKTMAVPGYACAACGKTYSSRLSLKEHCLECEAAICRDCWERKDVRYCREHQAKE